MYINLKELKQNIDSKGYTITNIWNVRLRITKEPLSMLFMKLKLAANNKNIYNINFLLQYEVKFEPHVKHEIPQYSRCQRYSHTKKFLLLVREMHQVR